MGKITIKAETVAALILFLIGVVVMVLSENYSIGSLRRMGPGYFPLILGGILSVLGLLLVFDKKDKESVKFHFPVRSFIALAAGILAFAFLIEKVGVVISIFSLVMLSTLGTRPYRFVEGLLISTVTSLLVIVVFIFGLGIPLSIFWG